MKKIGKSILFVLLPISLIIIGAVLFVGTGEKKLIETSKKIPQSKEEPTWTEYYCNSEFSEEAYGIDGNNISATATLVNGSDPDSKRDDYVYVKITGLPTSVKAIVTDDITVPSTKLEKYEDTPYTDLLGAYQKEFEVESNGKVTATLSLYDIEETYGTSVDFLQIALVAAEDKTGDTIGYDDASDTLEKNGCKTNTLLYYFTIDEYEEPEETFTNRFYDESKCSRYQSKYSDYPLLKDAIPYCKSSTNSKYTQTMVDSIMDTLESTYNLYQEVKTQTPLTRDETATQVSDANRQIKLYCDAYTNDTFNAEGKLTGYANSKKYQSRKEVENNEYCSTTCQETVTVNFQAPIKTEAGLCFSYQIEVKSVVECNTEINEDKKPQKRDICKATPACAHGANSAKKVKTCVDDPDATGCKSLSGGPNDDFDDCVMACDGGEYSQDCINQCYQTVYDEEIENPLEGMSAAIPEDNSNLMLDYQSSPRVVRVANRETEDQIKLKQDHPEYEDYDFTTFTGKKPTYKYKNGSYLSYDEIYEFRQHYPGGYYDSSDGWVQSGPVPSALGFFYYETRKRTETNIKVARYTYQNYFNNGRQYKWMPIESNDEGFRMRMVRDSDSSGAQKTFECEATCVWTKVSDGCSGDPDSIVLTKVQQEEQYNNDLAAYNAAIQKCAEAKKCNETTTNYTVEVDKGQETKNSKKYEASLRPGSTPNGNSIIQEYGGTCYYNGSTGAELGDSNENSQWDYRDVVSFPRQWLSVKSGTVTDRTPSNKNHYQDLGNTFCTNVNTEDVNVTWWKWKVNEDGNTSSLTAQEKTAIESERKNNITFHVGQGNNLWGFLGWNFDINCFYASAKPPQGEPDPEPILQKYIFRTISLDDMFPATSSQSSGREPRYNWSCDASNTINEAYPVQPSAAIKSIEDKGESIYNNADDLDYEIYLTREKIQQVRDYNRGKSYLDYDESTISPVTNGVSVYTSSFLTSVLGDAVKKRGLIGCNNQANSTSCQNNIVQDQCYNSLNGR